MSLRRILDFFDYMISFCVPYSRAVVSPERKTKHGFTMKSPSIWVVQNCHCWFILCQKLSELCLQLCWHLESQEVWLKYEKRQGKTEKKKKGPFKSQSKCWSLFLHFGLTSKELFEVSFYMISLRRRVLVKKERRERDSERENLQEVYSNTISITIYWISMCRGLLS